MIEDRKRRLAKQATVVAIAIPLALALWAAFADYGALGLAMGDFSVLFWVACALWLGSVALAVRHARRWWLLLLAPVVLLPVYVYAAIMTACLVDGRCL